MSSTSVSFWSTCSTCQPVGSSHSLRLHPGYQRLPTSANIAVLGSYLHELRVCVVTQTLMFSKTTLASAVFNNTGQESVAPTTKVVMVAAG